MNMNPLFLEKAFQNEPVIYKKQITNASFGQIVPDESNY